MDGKKWTKKVRSLVPNRPRGLEGEREKRWRQSSHSRRNRLDFTDFRILCFSGIAPACQASARCTARPMYAVIMAATCVLRELPYREESFQTAAKRRFVSRFYLTESTSCPHCFLSTSTFLGMFPYPMYPWTNSRLYKRFLKWPVFMYLQRWCCFWPINTYNNYVLYIGI